jgi:hypothetical protein
MKRPPTLVSLAEMKLRAEFKETLDLRQYPTNELKIIAPYAEKELVACGMPGHHLHKRGFIVLTPDQLITNVGHVCGSRCLGETWDFIALNFREREKDQATFDRVAQFLTQLPQFVARMTGLERGEHGMKWLFECYPVIDSLPSRVRNRLRGHIDSNDGEILEYTRKEDASADERELARLGIGRMSEGFHKRIGFIVGLDGVDRSRVRAIWDELTIPLLRYARMNSPTDMKAKERGPCANFFGSIEQSFKRAERALNEGRRFFTATNFAEIAKLADSARDREAVRDVWERIARIPTRPKPEPGGRAPQTH